MRVTLLGTGSADGWPNPFCRCASCQSARRTGASRGQTSALVDDVLLCDAGPETARAATAAGVDLADVAVVLLTHGHDDHVAPPLLLWRAWAHRTEPLTVVGPPAALDRLRDWVGPDDPVRFRAVTGGERLALPTTRGRYDVIVVPAAHHSPGAAAGSDTRAGDPWAAEAVLYGVTGPGGTRLLYATDTGPVPASTLDLLAGFRADAVLLEETFGDRTDHGTGHLDLGTFPNVLAALRGCGALTPDADVVAVHLSHHNPPAPELDRRLAAWGARTVPDGSTLAVGTPSGAPGAPRPRAESRPHRALVLGGARSGKSREAERRLADHPDVVYVATAGPTEGDPEWRQRVEHHRRRRPAAWRTVELDDPLALPTTIRSAVPGSVLLVDCLTLWCTRLLDAVDAWAEDPGAQARGHNAVAAACDDLLAALAGSPADVVLVSNEVGQGIVPATASGRLFRDCMGVLNARVASGCDEVALVVAGITVPLAGAPSARGDSAPPARGDSAPPAKMCP